MWAPLMCAEEYRLVLQALAGGDFAALGDRFAQGGLRVQSPGAGMLHITPTTSPSVSRLRLLISVGVHGNETAPIEMLAPVLLGLAETPDMLAVDLLIVVGNIAAIAVGSRYIEADLNRLFTDARGVSKHAVEAERADAIMQASANFFTLGEGPKWHLDLHSAIRPSRFPRFAVVPGAASDVSQRPLTNWLGTAGIDALVFNTRQAATYSAYTARALGALSCTVELGQISAFGENRPDHLLHTQGVVAALLRAQECRTENIPIRFRVEQEIVKHSDAFRMSVDNATQNFTAIAPGDIIAVDGTQVYRAGMATEYLIFPNPRVLIGHRAGLMVVEDR
ncbi:MAG: succinylglutamate desuccinylase [Burkholderiaceae bacterium]